MNCSGRLSLDSRRSGHAGSSHRIASLDFAMRFLLILIALLWSPPVRAQIEPVVIEDVDELDLSAFAPAPCDAPAPEWSTDLERLV